MWIINDERGLAANISRSFNDNRNGISVKSTISVSVFPHSWRSRSFNGNGRLQHMRLDQAIAIPKCRWLKARIFLKVLNEIGGLLKTGTMRYLFNSQGGIHE